MIPPPNTNLKQNPFSKIHIYLFTLVLVFFAIYQIIPELTYELEDFHKTERYYQDSEMFERERAIRQNPKRVDLRMSDNTVWIVRGTHEEFFDALTAESNVGKKFTFYTLSASDDEPIRIEIEDEIIFDTEVSKTVYYIILGITLLFVFISGKELLGRKAST